MTRPTDLPKKKGKTPKTVEVDDDLMILVNEEMKRKRLKFRQVVEWGLQKFLDESRKDKP